MADRTGISWRSIQGLESGSGLPDSRSKNLMEIHKNLEATSVVLIDLNGRGLPTLLDCFAPGYSIRANRHVQDTVLRGVESNSSSRFLFVPARLLLGCGALLNLVVHQRIRACPIGSMPRSFHHRSSSPTPWSAR